MSVADFSRSSIFHLVVMGTDLVEEPSWHAGLSGEDAQVHLCADDSGAPELFPERDPCVVVLGLQQDGSRERVARLLARYPQRRPVLVGVVEARMAAQVPSWLDTGLDDVLIAPDAGLLRRRVQVWRAWQEACIGLDLWRENQRLERMKNEFLATVHHELRTPLTSMLGALALLSSRVAGELPVKAAPLVDMAYRNGQRLSRLIDDVLDVAKLEDERLSLQLREVDLSALLSESVQANQSYADKSQVHLRLVSTVPVRVRVDPDRFLQVLANLISNAVKHSEAQACVEVGAVQVGLRVRVDVVDHGPGIPAAFRDRLFEKFSQADGSDRRAKGGTGLGLYITKLLVERMQGDITVASEPGQGAVFSVWLPLLSPDATKGSS